MQDRGPIGRVPHLLPVKWVDGWPILGDNGKGYVTGKKPDVGKTFAVKAPATTDEFNRMVLGLQWQWNHNPDNSRWSLTERKGYMRLHASYAANWKEARNTLTQRVQGPSSTGTVEMDITGLKNGDMAGLGIFEDPYAFIGIRKEAGSAQLVMVNDGKVIDSIAGVTQKNIWFRAGATDKEFIASFSYSLDGKRFIPFGNQLKMGLGLPWTANRFALFNFNTIAGNEGGYADFNWFHFAGGRQ